MKEIRNTTGILRALSKDAETTRTVEFVASDESRDAHGTVVSIKGWDLRRFNANGIIGYQHNVYGDLCGNSDPDRVIGTGEARIEGKQLIVRITFEPAEINPLAERIFQKVLYGTLKAVSVGFLPIGRGHWGEGDEAEDGENATYYYAGQELLEVSVVNIPSNKNALRRSLRSNTVDALNFIYRALDGEYRFSEIESFRVGEVLNLLERKGETLSGIRHTDDAHGANQGAAGGERLSGTVRTETTGTSGATVRTSGTGETETTESAETSGTGSASTSGTGEASQSDEAAEEARMASNDEEVAIAEALSLLA